MTQSIYIIICKHTLHSFYHMYMMICVCYSVCYENNRMNEYVLRVKSHIITRSGTFWLFFDLSIYGGMCLQPRVKCQNNNNQTKLLVTMCLCCTADSSTFDHHRLFLFQHDSNGSGFFFVAVAAYPYFVVVFIWRQLRGCLFA